MTTVKQGAPDMTMTITDLKDGDEAWSGVPREICITYKLNESAAREGYKNFILMEMHAELEPMPALALVPGRVYQVDTEMAGIRARYKAIMGRVQNVFRADSMATRFEADIWHFHQSN